MKRERSTRIASMLTQTTTRRGALRFLAAAALGSAGLTVLDAADADARKKRRRKRKKRQGGCQRGKPLAQVSVPHDGTTVHTPALEQGRRYRLRVSGVVSGHSLLTPIGVDAGYLFRAQSDQLVAHDVLNDIDYGLSVDGAAADWGDYASGHVYEREVLGQDQALALRLVTTANELNQGTGQMIAQRIITNPNPDLNLSGTLKVEILCA
jgi:hypothetical protein